MTTQNLLNFFVTSIYSCSWCGACYPENPCPNKQRHGLCIVTKNDRVFGNIGAMESMAAINTAEWCREEQEISGAPTQ